MPDFSTHLRTVHFTLILACVITFVSIIGGVGTEVERAHQQLLKVTQIKEDWNIWLNQWAREEARELEKAGIDQWTKVPSYINVCLPSPQNWQFQLRGSPLQFYFGVQQSRVRVLANAARESDGTLLFYPPAEPWPVTLDDFKAFWDSVHRIIFLAVDRVEPTLYFVHTGGAVDNHAWTTTPCDATSSSSLVLQYRGDDNVCSARVRGVPQLTGAIFCGDRPEKPITIAVPVVTRNQHVWSNLRSWLVNKYGLQAAGVGFDKDFAALSKVTTHYGSLPLNQAMQVLEGELQRSGERVQLVGLNLPLKMLSLTTVAIILAIQLYFLLHLWQFEPSQKDTEIAWVGLYDNVFARAITLGTALGLPLCTIIFVMIVRSSWWHLIPLTVSAALVFFSFPSLWKLPHVPIRSRWASSVIWKDIWRWITDFLRGKGRTDDV